jgi:signal transduction histidine kinase
MMDKLHPPSRSAIVVALAVIVLCFLGATTFAECNDLKIQSAAGEMIATSSGKEYLAAMRDGLHRLDDAVDAEGADDSTSASAGRVLDEVTTAWQAYRSLPAFPGERDLQPDIDKRLQALRDSIALIGPSHAEDDFGALRKHIAFDIQNTDEDVTKLVAINRREEGSRVSLIHALGRRSVHWAVLLDAISTGLAVVAGALLLLVVGRYERLMTNRADELDQFAGRVAHDILSPLSSVGMSLDLAQRASPAESRARRALARGRRSVDRVQHLVEALLEFARAGATPEPNALADVRRAVADALEEVRPAAASRGVTLEVAEPLPSCGVRCSPGNLSSVLLNLLTNAIKHMGDMFPRRVTISVVEQAPYVCFEISDTGPGLPASLGNRVFEPYVRGAPNETPGLGLGLATVKRLVEAHGGEVRAGTPPEGQGSRFWFNLPMPMLVRRRSTNVDQLTN